MGDTAEGSLGYFAGDCQLFAVSCESVIVFSGFGLLTLDRMLAVMTMNTGYFVSVLIGTFAGSVLLGAHTGAAGH
jgi:hypothetical protein